MNTQTPTTILIVEDDPLSLQTIIEQLKKLGLATAIAKSGEEALRQLEQISPELILLDIMLPGMDGFETCRLLKSKEKTKDIPVIFITALDGTADKVKGFEVGGVDYIAKPLDYREVTTRVETRLAIRKLQRQLQTKRSFVASKTAEISEAEKPLVLIVEDDMMTLDLLTEYLTRSKFKVNGVSTGEEAIQRAVELLPDVVLLDVLLPEMDGFEVCRHLKSDPATREIPVIFMTALLDISDKVKAFEAGGTDYITKPHHYAEVLARINAHITLRALQKQLGKKRH